MTSGKISGTPIEGCEVDALSIRATDAFDQASATGYAFAASVNAGPSNAVAWGSNGSGQLGDRTTTNRSTYVPVMTGKTYTRIASGNAHACGIVDGGSVECWGSNGYGQLGNGETGGARTSPVKVVGLTSGVTAITTGVGHTCAIHNGVAKCWGDNSRGQLGDGTTVSKATPITVINLSGSTVASIHSHPNAWSTCAGGVPKCWGKTVAGNLERATRSIERVRLRLSA